MVRILEDLMGLETTRPDEVEERLAQIYERIDEGDLNSAEESIRELKKRIGSDPELVRASTMIRSQALFGK